MKLKTALSELRKAFDDNLDLILGRATDALHWIGIGGTVACVFDPSTSIALLPFSGGFFVFSIVVEIRRRTL